MTPHLLESETFGVFFLDDFSAHSESQSQKPAVWIGLIAFGNTIIDDYYSLGASSVLSKDISPDFFFPATSKATTVAARLIYASI